MDWLYDVVVWFFTVIFDIFFREITPRGAYRIPLEGPLIFVAAPHANQFVDPMLLLIKVWWQNGRRLSFLVAEASLRRKFIGFVARSVGAIGVVRAQDNLKTKPGLIRLVNVDGDEGDKLRVVGEDTQFTRDCMVNGLIAVSAGSRVLASAEIAEIISDTELLLRREFKISSTNSKAKELLKIGTPYQSADHVNQSNMYKTVFEHLAHGRCLGIFPEGGSHDRSDLLPLKAGVAIMALGAMAEHPETTSSLKIVPCGMNYFHPNKFRSRAVIEFGTPFSVRPELVEQYKLGGDAKRAAVKELLQEITVQLKSVTVTAPDYDTLMVIQAARRLYYNPNSSNSENSGTANADEKPYSTTKYTVELTRRLLKGYNTYKDDPRIIDITRKVKDYNRRLKDLGLKDHQVQGAEREPLKICGKLVYRTLKLLVLLVAALPGTIMFSPVFIATKIISRRKAAAALRHSTVKIAARDVVATWKVLVAMGFTPLLYACYALLAVHRAYYHYDVHSWRGICMVLVASYVCLPSITFAALVVGETGIDILKSLRPLALALSPTHKNELLLLKQRRQDLCTELTELVNALGPEVFPDMNVRPKDSDSEDDDDEEKGLLRRRRSSSVSSQNSSISTSSHISRVGSGSDLSNIPVFSNVPETSVHKNEEMSKLIRDAVAFRRKTE